jgi:hypothetical protein
VSAVVKILHRPEGEFYVNTSNSVVTPAHRSADSAPVGHGECCRTWPDQGKHAPHVNAGTLFINASAQ